MTNTDLQTSIAHLMTEAGKAHHQAFIGTDGADLDWPIWYADYLREPISRFLQTSFTRSQLIYCVMNAEFEREIMAPDADWPRFYAEHFLELFAATNTSTKDKLALYHMPGCPFCALVRESIDRLGIDVELRDVSIDRQHFNDLLAARNRATVPVLQITSPDGHSRWMPESRDIVQYLDRTYG